MTEHNKYATFYQVRTSFIHFLVPGNMHNNHVRVSYIIKYIVLNIPTTNQTYSHKTFQHRYASIFPARTNNTVHAIRFRFYISFRREVVSMR